MFGMVQHETQALGFRWQAMPYELRVQGQPRERFETSDQAEARAREIVRANADAEVEIFDLSTGRPYAPAAAAGEREDMARKVGY